MLRITLAILWYAIGVYVVRRAMIKYAAREKRTWREPDDTLVMLVLATAGPLALLVCR